MNIMQKLANLKAPGLMDGWKITSTTRIIHGWLPSVISAQEYIYYFTKIWDDVTLNFHSPSLGLIH